MNINITEKAQIELDKVISKSDVTDKGLRIYIAGFGWGGPSFGLALDEQKDTDISVKAENIDFIIDEALTETYGGFKIDYTNDWLRKGFFITADRGGSSCS